MRPSAFRETLLRAQTGDRRAMEELLAAVRPHLERVARESVDSPTAAESASDLIQEVELRAWQKLSQFAGGASAEETLGLFHGWVGQIARRLHLDGHRNRNTQRRAPDLPILPLDRFPRGESSLDGGNDPPSSESTPSARVGATEGANKVQAALEAIQDSTDREIVRLYFFEALSLQQVSDRLNIPYSRVKERYRKTMGHLERELRSLL